MVLAAAPVSTGSKRVRGVRLGGDGHPVVIVCKGVKTAAEAGSELII